jgi:hypothetical protein
MIFVIIFTIFLSLFCSWQLTKPLKPEPLLIQDPIVTCPRCNKELISMGFSVEKYSCWSHGGFTIEPYREKSPAHTYRQEASEFHLDMYFPSLKSYITVGCSYKEGHYFQYENKIIKVPSFKPCESLEMINKYFKLAAFS